MLIQVPIPLFRCSARDAGLRQVLARAASIPALRSWLPTTRAMIARTDSHTVGARSIAGEGPAMMRTARGFTRRADLATGASCAWASQSPIASAIWCSSDDELEPPYPGTISRAMTVQPSSKQSDIAALAEHVAMTTATPLARLVPSASAVPDRSIDEWVEREQRRGRCSIAVGLTILAVVVLAAAALVLVWV